MKRILTFVFVVALVVFFGFMNALNRAEASAKKSEPEAESKHEKKAEEGDKPEASGHGGEKTEDEAKPEGGGHGEEQTAAKEEKNEPQFSYQFYDSVQSMADLMEEDASGDGEQVKTVYKVPASCSEFSMHLETKQKNLERLERELEYKKALLVKLKEEFDQAVQKYGDLEKRIQNLMRTGDSKFKDNPELAKMIKLYESISSEEAAERLKNLDLELTIAVLKGMNPKKLSQVMTALDPKISAALSSRMVRGF